ncbi:hypothetical protein MSAN_00790600 [Mycena sanguinolenta]|uniref:RINT-1 family protein n=1 Tax=Mycena sanguinolenta TaxID=230812 RepID=A0A8H7DD78_9AGAR|nr:hypothetical protein MSAN_00790600 [Mycena sanguinolenta]
MTSVQIRTLLAPSNIQEANHNAVFFVNSRFQSLDDLDALENAVLEAKQRDDQLKANLATSQANVNVLVSQTREAAQNHMRTAQSLSLQRHSLADELSYLFNQLTSAMSDGDRDSTLLEDIETLHRNLKELQSVKGYVQVIEHALKLSEAACHQIRSSPGTAPFSSASVTEYQSLQEFVSKVSDACADVEDGTGKQTLNLVLFLEKIRDKCWADIKATLSSSLLAASETLGWPMPVDYAAAPPQNRKDFERTFSDLLKLQTIGEKLRPPNPNGRSEKGWVISHTSLDTAHSFAVQISFRGLPPDQPNGQEWYFTHVLNVMHEHRPFMESVIQPLLSSTDRREIVAWREFTLLLFPLLSRKLRRSMSTLLPHPPLLAHTIYQALIFDAAINETGFDLAGTSAARETSDKWNGISDVILGKEEWFVAWMDGEKQFAENQYHEIISAIDAWQIAAEEGGEEAGHLRELRSTTSARRLKALVEQVTDHYSPLPHFAQRTRFLINVQIPILENYYGRISASLDAFETLSSAFIRAVPGALTVSLGRDDGSVKVDAHRLTDGVEGVQRLCKAWLSARYMEAAMEGWGEELFFLELWTEINRRASLRSQARAASSLPDPRAATSAAPQETVFEELVTQYRVLVNRAEDMVVAQVCGEVEAGLKAHFAATTSPNPNRKTAADDLALSQTLLGPISLLSTHMTYLCDTLPQKAMTALYRRIASRLAEHILQRQILYRGHISTLEGRSIHAECELWVETCHSGLRGALSGGRNRVQAPWLKLLQAGRLVGLEGEPWDRVGRATFGPQDQMQWEELMLETTGANELQREEVQRILKSKGD